MDIKSIKLEDCNPFVRYIHKFEPKQYLLKTLYVSCDERIFYVYKGEVTLAYSNGTVRLSQFQMVIFSAGTAYRISECSDDAILLGINFDYTRLSSNKRMPIAPLPSNIFSVSNLTESVEITEFVKYQTPTYIKNAAHLEERLEKILKEYQNASSLTDASLSAQLKLLLTDVASTLNTVSVSSSVVNLLMSYIQSNCTSQLNNHDIGKALRYHPNYLNRLLKQSIGKSLHEYLCQCRIYRASALLITTTSSIEEIATLSGFGDTQQFSKTFHRIVGYTPSQFRKMV